MKIYELTPDKTLADALDHALTVQTSETKSHTIKAYWQAKMPNVGLGDEFLTVTNNGAIRTITYPSNVFRGNVAITLYCKANSNGTAKLNRIGSLLEQLQSLVENRTYGDFHYKITANNVITPTSVNSTTGYATTVVNIEWRTT